MAEYKIIANHHTITMSGVLNLDLLQQIPCITNVPEETKALWEICLSDVWRPTSLAEWKYSIDSLEAASIRRTLFMNLPKDELRELTQIYGFPIIELPGIPSVKLVNNVLPENFESLCSRESKILRQTDISEEIAQRVAYGLPDIVVYLVLDGLSFHDVERWKFSEFLTVRFANLSLRLSVKCEPCFVDGLSITSMSMRRLIGSPCLTHRLFRLGYKQRLGFSYWERSQNKLTDELFSEFPPTQLFRVTTFEEVLHKLRDSDITDKTFIQIVRAGLDGYCHHHRERPDVNYLIGQLKRSIELVIESLTLHQKTVRIFVTSDHGILWFDEQKVTPFSSENFAPRYAEGKAENDAPTVLISENGEKYTVLVGDGVIARNHKVTEWGFHGGISAQESLVPLLEITPSY